MSYIIQPHLKSSIVIAAAEILATCFDHMDEFYKHWIAFSSYHPSFFFLHFSESKMEIQLSIPYHVVYSFTIVIQSCLQYFKSNLFLTLSCPCDEIENLLDPANLRRHILSLWLITRLLLRANFHFQWKKQISMTWQHAVVLFGLEEARNK